ncbi:MAG: hypothetical protein ACD_15C00104G0016 [uncultured bacterium]|nr:MAG: hypothetical protein ACD_15C00104G0016 [uncultured bacterium]
MLDKTKLAELLQKNAPLLYKLSCDSLLILVFFFVLVLIAEGLLPGIISTRLGLYKIVVVICANLLLTISIKNLFLSEDQNLPSQKILWISLGIALLLIFNSLFSLPIYLNLFILALSGAIIFYIFQVFEEK